MCVFLDCLVVCLFLCLLVSLFVCLFVCLFVGLIGWLMVWLFVYVCCVHNDAVVLFVHVVFVVLLFKLLVVSL